MGPNQPPQVGNISIGGPTNNPRFTDSQSRVIIKCEIIMNRNYLCRYVMFLGGPEFVLT